ncbi:HNH endonuclease [Frateuria edaphi]|uniref:HNH endonuclease signature motif containing protein n=1 Tax=Frateuria edaphi TaxID=2898793 RepID=UPI001E2F46EA|nr:HNH endonuclease signature motif containing protein [Frateuria edaphi]UGB46954.1 HNH endonuclease [Frateuria edaphi]
MKGQARRWSAFDDDVLRQLHANGRGVAYIAAFMVCAQCTVHRRARRLGLTFDEKHQWTPAEDAVLRARYPDEPTADIARDLGLNVGRVHQRANKLGLSKSDTFYASDKAGRIQRGRQDPRMVAHQFKKGLVPANKGLRRPGYAPGRMAQTQFKKGEMSGAAQHNYVPIGTEKVDPKRKVLMRKVTDDPSIFPVKRWRPVHVIVWEAAHGPVPAGHIVIFKKGRKSFVADEITVDRLELVTLAENMRRNSYHTNFPPEVVQVIQLKGALNRKINKLSREQKQ